MALDEYERLMRERKTPLPPFVSRVEDPDYQRWYGRALTHIDGSRRKMCPRK